MNINKHTTGCFSFSDKTGILTLKNNTFGSYIHFHLLSIILSIKGLKTFQWETDLILVRNKIVDPYGLVKWSFRNSLVKWIQVRFLQGFSLLKHSLIRGVGVKGEILIILHHKNIIINFNNIFSFLKLCNTLEKISLKFFIKKKLNPNVTYSKSLVSQIQN